MTNSKSLSLNVKTHVSRIQSRMGACFVDRNYSKEDICTFLFMVQFRKVTGKNFEEDF